MRHLFGGESTIHRVVRQQWSQKADYLTGFGCFFTVSRLTQRKRGALSALSECRDTLFDCVGDIKCHMYNAVRLTLLTLKGPLLSFNHNIVPSMLIDYNAC